MANRSLDFWCVTFLAHLIKFLCNFKGAVHHQVTFYRTWQKFAQTKGAVVDKTACVICNSATLDPQLFLPLLLPYEPILNQRSKTFKFCYLFLETKRTNVKRQCFNHLFYCRIKNSLYNTIII